MGARCGACGQSVMPYRKYLFYSKPTATCGACGAHVRMRGWWALVTGGVGLLAILFATLLLTESMALFVGVCLALVVLAFAIDYGSYRALSWEPDRPTPA